MFENNYYLIFTSKCDEGFSEMDVLSLVHLCQRGNMDHNVTSVMLHKPGQILQLLEGEKADVLVRFEQIKLDTNHYDVDLLFDSAGSPPVASEALFFRNEKHEFSKGYRVFMKRHFDFKKLRAHPRMMIEFFRDVQRPKEGDESDLNDFEKRLQQESKVSGGISLGDLS